MDELAKRFADLAEKFGPKVVDAALGAARVEAYSTLVRGLMALSAAGGIFYLGWYVNAQIKTKDWDADFTWVSAIILWFLSSVFLVIGVWAWIDPWTWTTINHPDLWIAKKAFKL